MVAYSFNPRFEEQILAGTKCGTIRAVGRRRHARAGETIQLYVGQRTRHCRLLGSAVCTAVDGITLAIDNWRTGPAIRIIHIHDVGSWRPFRQSLVGSGELDEFARSDGFENEADMAAFWWQAHRNLISGSEISFSGLRIQWAPLGGPHVLD